MRGSAWGLTTRLARVALTVSSIAVLARLLTPSDFGVYAISSITVTFAFVVCEGLLDFPIVRYDHLTRRHVRGLVWLAIATLTVLCSALVLVGSALANVLGSLHLREALILTIPAILAQPHTVTALAVMRREHLFRRAFLSTLVPPLLFGAVGIPLALARPDTTSLVIAQSVSIVGNAVLLVMMTRVPLLPPWRPDFGGVIGDAVSGSASRVVAWTTSNIDTVVVGIVLGPAATGIYSRAYAMNVQLKEPFSIVETMTRQALASLRSADRLRGETLEGTFRLLTLAAAMVAGTVTIASDGLVALLLGAQWSQAGPLLAILALALPARVGLNFLDGLSITTGRVPAMLWRTVAGLVITAVGLVLLAERGLPWVAWVVTGGVYVSLFVPLGDRTTFALGLRTRAATVAPSLTLLAGLAAAGWWVRHEVPATWVQLLLAAATAGLASAALVSLAPSRWLPSRSGAELPRGPHRLMLLAPRRRKDAR